MIQGSLAYLLKGEWWGVVVAPRLHCQTVWVFRVVLVLLSNGQAHGSCWQPPYLYSGTLKHYHPFQWCQPVVRGRWQFVEFGDGGVSIATVAPPWVSHLVVSRYTLVMVFPHTRQLSHLVRPCHPRSVVCVMCR